MVPLSLAAEISATLHDLKHTKFSLEFAEFEAREVILALFEKNSADSDSMDAKLEAIQIATSRLEIKSPRSLIVEKEALEKQLDKFNDTNHRDKERLDYLLDLLTQYGKFIQQPQNGNHSLQHEPHHYQSLEHELIVVVDEAICDNQVNDSNDTIVGDFELLST